MVTVTNTANGLSVTVRINDRGSFAATAAQPFCLDLTDGAFQRIGAISPDRALRGERGHDVRQYHRGKHGRHGRHRRHQSVGAVHGLAGKCVDVAGASFGRRRRRPALRLQRTAAQSWTISSDGTLRALGKCLDITNGSTADGAKAQLYTCNGSGAQKWQPQTGNLLVNPQSGKCLDAPATPPPTAPASKSGPATAPPTSNGPSHLTWPDRT